LPLTAGAVEPSAAPPASKFRERFGLFQPKAVKQALKAAKAFDKVDSDSGRHDQVLIDAANEGMKHNTLSLRSLTFLAGQTGLATSQDRIGLAIARQKGPALTFKEQKLLVRKGTYSIDGAREVANLLIDQHKGELTLGQANKLRDYAATYAAPAATSSSSATSSFATSLAIAVALSTLNRQ
jgi:hypothetical protein